VKAITFAKIHIQGVVARRIVFRILPETGEYIKCATRRLGA
jgi:hypothetical protein